MPPLTIFQPQSVTAPAYMPQAVLQAQTQIQPMGAAPMHSQASSQATMSSVKTQPDAHTRRLRAIVGTEKG